MRGAHLLSSVFVKIGLLALALGANREKTLSRYVDDSMWTLNGDTVRLTCSNPFTTTSEWLRQTPDNRETPLSNTSTNVIKTTDAGSVLTLTMSPSLNESSYRCRLFDFKASFSSGWIKLLLGDEIKLNCSGTIASCTNAGNTLRKECVIRGTPEPNVTVSKTTLSAARPPLANLSGLTFRNVALTDRGTYRLAAKNALDEISTEISVQTEVDICLAPVFDRLLVPRPIVCLDTVRINATVKGIPTPRVTWNRGSAFLVSMISSSVDSDGNASVVESSLVLENVRRADDNICVTADNDVSPSRQKCFKLNVTCDIYPPRVELDDRTESSLSLRISDNSRLPTTEYFITYWPSNSPAKNITIERNPSGQTRVDLIDLDPSAIYNVRVTRNHTYYSQPVDGVFATLEERDCVPILRRQDAESPTLTISWSYVCEGSRTLKEIASYLIVYESSNDYRRFGVDESVIEYTFDDLFSNVTYNFSVTAVARDGAVRTSNILTVYVEKNRGNEVTGAVRSLLAVFVLLGFLVVALGLVALYLLCYIKRLKKRSQENGSSVEMHSNRIYEEAKKNVHHLGQEDAKRSSAEYAQIS